MDVCKVCPRLITMNQDCTSYTGYIDTCQGRQFKVQIQLKSRSSLKGARVRCEWALQTLLRGHSHILQQRLNQASSLTTFLEDIKSLVERRLDETTEPEAASSRLCGEVLQQLEALGWDRLLSVDPSFQRFELKAVDGGKRTHILRVQLHAQHPERPPTCQVDLPRHFNFQWSQQRQLAGLYEQFEQSLVGFQDFWDEMARIDRTTWVLEPEKPTHSATHRRIVLSASASLQLSVDPTSPRLLPECRFLGSDQAVQPFQDNFNKNLQIWDDGASLVDNLQRLLEHEFPSPSNTRKEDFSVECGICYAYRLDMEIPDKTCDDSRCGQPFHSTCLYEWLRGLPSSRQSFNTVFGECPYCSKTITVKMPSTS